MKLKLARCFCNTKPKLWRSKSSFSISCPCKFPCRGFSSVVSWERVANAWNAWNGSDVGFFPREEYDTQTLDTRIDGYSVQTAMETPKMSAVKIYWMVMGNARPTFKHSIRQAAIEEAQRLANENKGCEFFVIEVIGSAKVSPTFNYFENVPF